VNWPSLLVHQYPYHSALLKFSVFSLRSILQISQLVVVIPPLVIELVPCSAVKAPNIGLLGQILVDEEVLPAKPEAYFWACVSFFESVDPVLKIPPLIWVSIRLVILQVETYPVFWNNSPLQVLSHWHPESPWLNNYVLEVVLVIEGEVEPLSFKGVLKLHSFLRLVWVWILQLVY